MADDKEFQALQGMLAASQAMVAAQAERIIELTEQVENLSNELYDIEEGGEKGSGSGQEPKPMAGSSGGLLNYDRQSASQKDPADMNEKIKRLLEDQEPTELSGIGRKALKKLLGMAQPDQSPKRGDRLTINVSRSFIDDCLEVSVRGPSMQVLHKITADRIMEVRKLTPNNYGPALMRQVMEITNKALEEGVIYRELYDECAEALMNKLIVAIGRGVAT